MVTQTVAAEIGSAFTFAECTINTNVVRYRIPDAFCHRLSGKRVAIVDDTINAGSTTRVPHAELMSCGRHPVAIGSLPLLGNIALPFFAEEGLPVERIARCPTISGSRLAALRREPTAQ
ncbi:MAG: hypothetical protein JSR91_14455 [Proteobacteria bacterium]|nr:hypothetical protein [Pseudomonadota bacterium]